jgi:iron complex transport system permease protein
MTTTDAAQAVAAARHREQQVGPVVAARAVGLLVALAALALMVLISLRVGSLGITTRDAWDALFNYDSETYNQTVVRTLRLPRTIIAIGVGSALAIAGATMQAVTRNPLAEPSILGVSSGASFAIVTAVYYIGLTEAWQYVWFAFAGAMIASAVVFAIGSAGRDGPSPVKLALAGVVISALLSSWSSALLLLDEETLDVVRFWLAGSVAGRSLDTFWTVAPFLIGGSLICLFLGHQLNVLNLGEDSARSLGMRTGRTRLICSILVVLMTGAAVSAAGPIAFVGLATPHIVRSIIGPDYRWVLPYSAIVGAILLLGADVAGRVVARPAEIQVGIMTAAVGAPFLIYLARQRTVES